MANLSTGGEPILTGEDPSLPTYVRQEWKEAVPDLRLLYRLLAGTRTMHYHAREYIRKWKDETEVTYKVRSTIEQVFEGLGRTLSAAIGMVFAKPPAIEWIVQEEELEATLGEKDELIDETLKEHWKNIDGAGTKGAVFLKQFAETTIRDGLALLLVDFSLPKQDPSTGEPMEIRADEEQDMNLRPTWARYDREFIRNWRVDKINNQEKLTLLTLYEPALIDDGLFGVLTEHRWRVLRLSPGLSEDGELIGMMVAHWELWRLRPGAKGDELGDFETVDMGVFYNANGETYDTLPVAVAYAGRRLGPMQAVPPLLGVAWANLGLWQISSNHRFYLDLACFPQPTVIGKLAETQGGLDDEGNRLTVPGKLKLGPMVAVHLGAGSKETGPSSYAFTVPPPDGFEPNERAMTKKREDMAALGMSFLNRDKRTAETAEAKRLDATAENATLATTAQGLDDAVNWAWKHHAWYLGRDPETAPEVTLNRDFESVAMSSQVMSAWISGVEKAGIPAWVLLEAWQRGGQIPDGVDIDELSLEMEVDRVAKEEQARMEAEQRSIELALGAIGAEQGEE